MLIEATPHPDSIFHRIDVHNYGGQPILDVTIENVTLLGPNAHWKIRDDSDPIIRMIRSETEEAFHSFTGEFVNPDGSPISSHSINRYGTPHYDNKPDPGLITAAIRFSDVNGNTWRVDTDRFLTYTGVAR